MIRNGKRTLNATAIESVVAISLFFSFFFFGGGGGGLLVVVLFCFCLCFFVCLFVCLFVVVFRSLNIFFIPASRSGSDRFLLEILLQEVSVSAYVL